MSAAQIAQAIREESAQLKTVLGDTKALLSDACGLLTDVRTRLLNVETLLASVPVIVQNAPLQISGVVTAGAAFPITTDTPFSVTGTAATTPIPVTVTA